MNSTCENITNNKILNSILFISEDLDYIKKYKVQFDDKYNVTFFNNDKFYLLEDELNSFNLIVFDNNYNALYKFIEIFKLAKTYNFNIPMIVLQNQIPENILTIKDANACMVLDKNIDEKLLIANIEMTLSFVYTNKKVQFENGFYFDVNREVLFQGKKIIKLTKIEKKLVHILAINPNTLVTYEDISKVVWKGKEFSIFSLRNVVKHIREKTDETFIKNSSNKGYVITTI